MYLAAVCAGILGLLVFGLGIAVSMTRGATNTVIGFNPDPADRLYKMIRAHGNATEFNPMLAILILFVGSRQPAAWLGWVFVIAALSRVLHAAGMIMSPTLAKPQPLRATGAVGTYVCGLILAVETILLAS
ncbi:MAG TPA: MAPEG family protein [Candidatus Eisenbacteria bacterium]|nr:MAPEG family protein [Candidatus Eisenbacteria bacterium]